MPIELCEVERPAWGQVVPQLQIVEGDRVVLAYQLRAARTVIGRSDACDVALPSDTVSRVHCLVERRGDQWWLIDRSRRGTRLQGVPVTDAELTVGSAFEVGPYQVRFVEPSDGAGNATMTRVARPADHEELVDVADGLVAWRAELRVVGGPIRGQHYELGRTRTRVGGHGAHVVLSPAMPSDAMTVRVVRGRAMIEPGAVPVFLAGSRVREITPVFDDETLRLGPHELAVHAHLVEEGPSAADGLGDLVGQSEAMRRLYGVLDRGSRHDATVMILGESGSGKELAARALHDLGTRSDGPFVAVNCASIPSTLVESELFGHEAGAFTGAAKRTDGAFQRANRGTLFLDELGEMSMDAQAKLLRALESGEVRRVGGQKPEYPDVRLVAATHQNLAKLAEEGRFRKDLLFRLAVLAVHMPPLRAHKDDLPLIARSLLARHHPGARLTDGALRSLAVYDWPGNVRELRNVLTRAVVLHGPVIDAANLTFNPWAFEAPEPVAMWTPEQSERDRITDLLREHGGNRSEAARALGIPRTSLLYKMRKLGMD